SFLAKGGIFMIPILACSVAALAIFLERLWNLRRGKIIPPAFMMELEDLIRNEKIPRAIELCRRSGTPIAKVLVSAIKNFGRRREVLKERIEEVGRREAAVMTRYMEALATIANVSTLIGLLGTIAGMIEVFSVISEQTAISPTSMAHGISVALYTTVFGLSVAIPTLVGHRYLSGRADGLILQMEETSIEMMELLKEKEAELG
ncbi:MAG: MotA/TolQ/ExbB proton channel family protein, partial [Thermodesulfobacteriota bacterium]